MSLSELDDYRDFTKPAELHKAINTLKGIVAGITTDMKTCDNEIQELLHWCTLHAHLRDRHPFSELLPLIEAAYADDVISDEEAKDIIWLCNNFMSDAACFDLITSTIQFLSGLLQGVMADGVLCDTEVRALSKWIDANSYLEGCYPYDEIQALLHSVLEDGRIDDNERNKLMAFFSNFIDTKTSYNINEPEMDELRKQYDIKGICAVNPTVEVEGRTFCFTGISHLATRKNIEKHVIHVGGVFKASVTKDTDYLIVGDGGNPCWAYSCYGRKVEEAVKMRKKGHKIQIVKEADFWGTFSRGV